MRQPRPAEVLDAVEHVLGVDPRRKYGDPQATPRVVASRRLGVASLRELCGLSYKECARVLGYRDHTTVIHHARGNVNLRLLKAVLQRVSDKLMEEEAAEQARRMEVAGWQL